MWSVLVVLVNQVASFAANDPGWELLATSALEEVPRTCFAAKGLPKCIQGAYFISGPALFEMGGYNFAGLFDGLGKINRFELRGGQKEICYTSAFLKTGTYRAALQTGTATHGVLFEDTTPSRPACPLLDPMCNIAAPNDNNWVSMIVVGGEALLLSDTPTMVKLNTDTLNVTGLKTWADDKKGMLGPPHPTWTSPLHEATVGSAHPLQRPGTQTFVEVMMEMAILPEEKNIVDVYTFDSKHVGLQNRTKIASLRCDNLQYLHSFGVTPNYVVLPFNLMFKMSSLTNPIMVGNFHSSWRGIQLVDLVGNVQIFDTDSFFHAHVINSFENGTGIVLDVCTQHTNAFAKTPMLDIGLFLNKTARDTSTSKAGVRRFHLHLSGPQKGATTSEALLHQPMRSVEFPKINTRFTGLPYCVYYAVEWWHDNASYASMAILKHDICLGTKKYWSRPNTYPGEPFFIEDTSTAAAIEDQGVLVFQALDGIQKHSIFVTLDAETMKELHVVNLAVHVPFTGHGHFIPDIAVE